MRTEGPPARPSIDPALVRAAIEEAQEAGREVAAVSLNRVARRAGVSRATLFRRIGNREALEAAVAAAGVDPGRRQDLGDRVLVAARRLIETEGLERLTLDAVARQAGCSVSSVHTRFDGRTGLLSAMFERDSPIAEVERMLAERPARFEEQVKLVHRHFFDAAAGRTGVLAALLTQVLGDPDGEVATFFRTEAAPRFVRSLGAWLREEAARGSCRDEPPAVLVPLLLGPLLMYLLARADREREGGCAFPASEDAIEALTAAFCRAVAR